VLAWLEGIFNEVIALPQKAANAVVEAIKEPLDLIVERIKDHVWTIASIIDASIEALLPKLSPLFDAIKTAVLTQFEALNSFLMTQFIEATTALTEAREAIQNFVTDRVNALWSFLIDRLGALYVDLSSEIRESGRLIIEHPLLVAGPAGIALEVFKQVFPPIENIVKISFEMATGAVKVWFDELKDWFVTAVTDPITDWFTGLTDRLISYFEAFKEWLSTWIRDLGRLIIEFFSEELVQAVMNALTWLRLRAQEFMSSFWDSIVGYIMTLGRVTPERGPDVAQNLLSIASFTAVGLGIFTVAGRAMSWMAGHGLGNLAAIVGDLVNYRTLTAAWVGILATCLITTPLRYYYNYMFRPWIPDRGTIAEAMSRNLFARPEVLLPPHLAGQISALVGFDPEEYERRLLGYHGYGDEYYAIFKELAHTPARYFPLRMVADIGVYDERWFREELQRAGYAPTTIEILLDVFRRQALGELRGIYISTAMNLYKEGFITDAEMKMHLRALGVPEARLEQYAYAAVLAYEYDVKKDWLDAYREAYRKGLIDDSEFRTRLRELGVRWEKIEAYLYREQARRYGKTARGS